MQAAAGERARITAAGGFISDVGGVSRVNGNLNLSRAIGDLKYKGNQQLPPADQIITAQPDIVKMELTPADRFFLLACDGVWDVMSNQARRAVGSSCGRQRSASCCLAGARTRSGTAGRKQCRTHEWTWLRRVTARSGAGGVEVRVGAREGASPWQWCDF